MTKNAFILNFLKLYNRVWQLILPLLKRHRRLKPGFDERISTAHLKPADIWIQAASAGEAYLAVRLIRQMVLTAPTRVLVTSITSQGLDILKTNLAKESHDPLMDLSIQWFVFDMPRVIQQAVTIINPRVMVLLETELWPALLYYLKQNRSKVVVINGRLSKKSHAHYFHTRLLWKHLAPDLILATSHRDRQRYQRIFKSSQVSTMSNIKFETFDDSPAPANQIRAIKRQFPGTLPLTILASVRRQEEKMVLAMIQSLKTRFPDQVIAVFPRHMHRIPVWKRQLKKNNLRFVLRSDPDTGLTGPGIILWDRFGELATACGFATVVFVGGSLKPLGGQNFIEPAIRGAVTVTGPYYDDFAWVGDGLFSKKIVCRESGAGPAVQTMVSALKEPPDRWEIIAVCKAYLRDHRGGTARACRSILHFLTS